MNVAVVTEQRFDRTPDGEVWARSTSYEFWRRYLDVFSGVTVIARVRDVQDPSPDVARASGPGVTFKAVPYYIGPWQYLRVAWRVHRAAMEGLGIENAIVLRLGSQIAASLAPHLWRTIRPYGVEVVGDPEDVFAPEVVRHPLRPLLRRWFGAIQKELCARACGAAYVTAWTLQKKYPCGALSVGISDAQIERREIRERDVVTTHYSSMTLTGDQYIAQSGCRSFAGKGTQIITVGSLDQLYKGVDVLVKAMAVIAAREPSIGLTVVGEGKYKGALEKLSAELGVADRVMFRGALPPGAAVRDALDAADMFVLASRTEGLPRALIEAMARGLPCIATAVGGIPELLRAEDLVPAGDCQALAEKILQVVSDPERGATMGRRNLEKAWEFEDTLLNARRISFYRHVERVTDAWLTARGLICEPSTS